MTTCLSPVNLSAPMSSFFLKPVSGAAYLPFPRELLASTSTVTRQPRGPPEASAKPARKGVPAPVSVPAPTAAPTSSWRDRVSAGPAEMPSKASPSRTPSKSSRTSPAAKSGGKPKGRRTSPAPAHSRSASVSAPTSAARSASPMSAPVIGFEKPETDVGVVPMSAPAGGRTENASRVYDMTFLLCLAASPLNAVTEAEYTHMEDLVWNYTWRRGPHQSVDGSRSSSGSPRTASSSRASSPARSATSSSRSSSPRASSPASPERVQSLRRNGHSRRTSSSSSSKLRRATSDSSSSISD